MVRRAGDIRHIYFLVLPQVHMLDLSGPAQAFFEANECGARYALHHVSPQPQVVSAQGLAFANLDPLPKLGPADTLVVAGLDSEHMDQTYPCDWLRATYEAGARICSVCTGAFVLARAGLLEGRRCTSHWKLLDLLRTWSPKAQVLDNRLFVEDGNVTTSAGMASGIDMVFSMIERDYGPEVVGRTAREMVLYLRRDGHMPQESVYLQYRNHLHPGVHKVQDQVTTCPEKNFTIAELADAAGMSPRNLTRVFRSETGVTLKTFMSGVKLEVASNLMNNDNLTVEFIAARCGFEHPRQLRRLWKQAYGNTPSQWRAALGRRAPLGF